MAAVAPNLSVLVGDIVGADEVEVTTDAEQAWVDHLLAGMRMFGGAADCTPGYYNNEGQLPTPADRRNAGGYPAGPAAYFDFIKEWRKSEKFEGLEFRHK